MNQNTTKDHHKSSVAPMLVHLVPWCGRTFGAMFSKESLPANQAGSVYDYTNKTFTLWRVPFALRRGPYALLSVPLTCSWYITLLMITHGKKRILN